MTTTAENQLLPCLASEAEQRRLLQAVFANASVALFVMDEHQHCWFVNPAAENMTGYSLAEMRGRPLHDVIHHTRPDGTHYPIEECPIDRAFPERMQMQGEDVFVHKDGSFFPVAYTASPLRDETRTVGTIIEVRALTRERAAEAAAMAAAHRAQDLFDRVSDSIVVFDADFRLIDINRRALDLDGRARTETVGRTFWELWPGWIDTPALARMHEALRRREPFEVEHHYRTVPHDQRLEVRGFPTVTGGMAMFFRDVTARHEAERQRELLVHELNHRVKNTLAVVQGIAWQALRGRAEPEALAGFSGRLQALAAAHDILTERGWVAAGIGHVVARAVHVHGGDDTGRIAVDGDGDAELSPKAAVALSMALHELATNAAKHGALSVPEGRVRLRWRTEFGVVRLVWEESGGPPIAGEPTRQGFGMRLLRRSIADELGGSLTALFQPTGIVCTMELPLTAAQTA